jgi:hypothetical protein
MCSPSSRPGQDVSCGNEALDIAQVSSKPQATSLETLEHVRLPSLSVARGQAGGPLGIALDIIAGARA